jgi:predicted MFS family arabinose efflux permease
MGAAEPKTAAAEWQAYWPTVLSGMIGMSFYAMLTYHFGLFIEPLEKEFHWPRASISVGLGIYTGTAVLFGPFVGALIDRIGSRWIGIFGLATTALSFAALSLANGSLTQWYLLWGAIAATALFVKSTLWGAATSSLFTTSRSLALSIVLAGSAIAQFASPLLGTALITNLGWRAAYRWIGLGWGGIALLLVLFMFFDARDHGKRSGNAAPDTSTLGGLTVAEALRSPQILRIALANLLMSSLGAGVAAHMMPILSSNGIGRAEAAGIASLAGISGIAGKLLTGWLLDKYQGNLIPFVSFALQAVGYALLLNTFRTTTSLALGVLVLGYTAGAGLQVTTYLTTRYAGLRNFGKIYATIASMMMLGTTIGPWIAGSVYDHTHSYDVLLTVAVPIMLVGALMFVGLGAYPSFATDASDESKLQ